MSAPRPPLPRADAGRPVLEVGAATDDDGLLLLNDIVRRWKHMAALTLVTAVIGISLSFLIGAEFSSRTSFMPEQQQRSVGAANAFLGLASQLGMGLAGGGQAPQLYTDLIHSTSITDTVLATRVAGATGGPTLADVLEPGARPATDDWEKARTRLSARTSATLNPRTNVIELLVRMPSPALAQLATTRYLQALNQFNRATRQTSARARREFVEHRMAETQDSLRAAEDALTQFLASNRTFETSPSLRFTRDRLQRRLDGAQEIFVSLRREFESARLDEVNDQPLLTIIDAPSLPTRRMSAHRVAYLALGIGLGVLGALIGALGRVTCLRIRLDDPARFAQLSAQFGGVPVVRRWVRAAAAPRPEPAPW